MDGIYRYIPELYYYNMVAILEVFSVSERDDGEKMD